MESEPAKSWIYSFYDRKDVVQIARELLGKILVTQLDGIRSSGRIVETEAYAGVNDRASHAFGGRRTTQIRTSIWRTGDCHMYISVMVCIIFLM